MQGNNPSRDMVDRMVTVVKRINPARIARVGVLDELVAGAVEIFPEIDDAGLSVTYRDGRVETVTARTDLPTRLDAIQARLREGPNHDAFIDETLVLIQNARHDDRWPGYTAEAAALGLRAQLTLRLYVTNHSVANLNLYSTESETVSEDTVAMAEVHASHVAAVLGRSEAQDELTSAMLTRQLIGQATGILMERLQLGPDEAFAYLVRLSSTRNVKVRELARRVTAGEDISKG